MITKKTSPRWQHSKDISVRFTRNGRRLRLEMQTRGKLLEAVEATCERRGVTPDQLLAEVLGVSRPQISL